LQNKIRLAGYTDLRLRDDDSGRHLVDAKAGNCSVIIVVFGLALPNGQQQFDVARINGALQRRTYLDIPKEELFKLFPDCRP
jgi:hypothetical protein